MATNLIDRLYNPRLFLDTINERLNRDGVLVITSPYTWQESSTEKEFWLGGKVDKDGNEIKTIDDIFNFSEQLNNTVDRYEESKNNKNNPVG